jgi:isopenicillin N synthase-like dioxygenase
MKAPHPSGAAVHRGYSWPGLEKVSDIVLAEGEEVEEGKGVREVADVKESYEIGSDDYADQPNVWLPEDVLPGFREFTTQFYWECEKFTRLLMQALALGLGLEDQNTLAKFHNGHENQLRLLHYPPVKAELLEKEAVERMPAHTDWGTLTILFQDEVGGLECLEREGGEFVKVGWVDGAVVMNLGDALGRWSNGMLTLPTKSGLNSCWFWMMRVCSDKEFRHVEVDNASCRPATGKE